MTTSNNPQSPSEGKTKPVSLADFRNKFEQRVAEKMVNNAEKVEQRAATKADRAARPLTPQEIKEFFDKKKEQEAKRTPEEKQKAVASFFQRKADQKTRDEKGHLDTLKAQPAHKDTPETKLIKLAEVRNAFEKENMKAKVSDKQLEKAMAGFDKAFSDPKKLDDLMEKAAQKAELIKESKAIVPKEKDNGLSH